MTQRFTRTHVELEQAFAHEVSLERQRQLWLLKTAETRSRKRAAKRSHRRGSLRFALLILTLLMTAAIVTFAMFATLYLLLH